VKLLARSNRSSRTDSIQTHNQEKPMAKQKRSKPTTAASPVLVHFEFVHPTAQRVCIAGTFNEWHGVATQMIGMGEGRWAKELLLPPGTYEYRFVVDGDWVTDPNSKETAANPFGSHNTILRVQPPT
jgi:5'-AMP-activated protein kinase regulatory beta subunit